MNANIVVKSATFITFSILFIHLGTLLYISVSNTFTTNLTPYILLDKLKSFIDWLLIDLIAIAHNIILIYICLNLKKV